MTSLLRALATGVLTPFERSELVHFNLSLNPTALEEILKTKRCLLTHPLDDKLPNGLRLTEALGCKIGVVPRPCHSMSIRSAKISSLYSVSVLSRLADFLKLEGTEKAFICLDYQIAINDETPQGSSWVGDTFGNELYINMKSLRLEFVCTLLDYSSKGHHSTSVAILMTSNMNFLRIKDLRNAIRESVNRDSTLLDAMTGLLQETIKDVTM